MRSSPRPGLVPRDRANVSLCDGVVAWSPQPPFCTLFSLGHSPTPDGSFPHHPTSASLRNQVKSLRPLSRLCLWFKPTL